MSLTRKIAHNTLIQYFGKIVGTLLGLFAIGLITRYLGQEGFGYYTTIIGFLQFFAVAVDFGLTLTTSQMLVHSKWDEEQLFSNILSFRIVSATLFLGVAPIVALFFPYPGFVKLAIAVTAASFLFTSLTQIFLGFYQKHLNLSFFALSEIGNRIFLLVAVLAVMFFDWGLFGILVVVILSNLLQVIMLAIPARRFSRIYLSVHWPLWKDIWMTTWPIALSIALNLLYLRTDVIVLSVVRSPEEVGLYGAAYKVIDVLASFPVIFAGILLPLLTRYWKTEDRPRFNRLIQQGFDAMSLFAWPIMVGTLFVSGDMMALIAGEEFRPAGNLLNLLIWASGIIFLNAVFAHAIVAMDKQKSTIWAYATAAILGLIGYAIFIPLYGATGAAAMTIVTEGLVALLVFLMYRKFAKVNPSLRIWVGSLVCSGFMALALWQVEHTHLVVKMAVATIVYSLSLLLTRTVSKRFVREILTLKRYTV